MSIRPLDVQVNFQSLKPMAEIVAHEQNFAAEEQKRDNAISASTAADRPTQVTGLNESDGLAETGLNFNRQTEDSAFEKDEQDFLDHNSADRGGRKNNYPAHNASETAKSPEESANDRQLDVLA